MKADFYYLTRTPLDRALPAIAERVRASGERLHIAADDAGLLDQLDALLWVYKPESFLPHGRSGDQPILLAPPGAALGYPNIAFVDGLWRDPPEGTVRVFYFFDAASLDAARTAWRGLGEQPVERRYWKQDENGRWVEGP
ncbi:MAG: DNA polymerase III subunit chi [Chakrabartia sp.]